MRPVIYTQLQMKLRDHSELKKHFSKGRLCTGMESYPQQVNRMRSIREDLAPEAVLRSGGSRSGGCLARDFVVPGRNSLPSSGKNKTSLNSPWGFTSEGRLPPVVRTANYQHAKDFSRLSRTFVPVVMQSLGQLSTVHSNSGHL